MAKLSINVVWKRCLTNFTQVINIYFYYKIYVLFNIKMYSYILQNYIVLKVSKVHSEKIVDI